MDDLTDHLLLLLADALVATDHALALRATSVSTLARIRLLAAALAKAIDDHWLNAATRDTFDDEDEPQLYLDEYDISDQPT